LKSDKITVGKISEALGISSVSVTRALSGQCGVSGDLRNKIFEKAKEMGYIKINKEYRLNVLVLHKKPYEKDNSNFSFKVQGIETALQDAGMDYSMEFIDKLKSDNLSLPFKITKGVSFDGSILIGRFTSEYADLISSKLKNLVFYTGYSPAHNYDCVWFNFSNSAYIQCEYLISNGHKNIGFLGNKGSYKNKEKLMGITTALENHKLPVIQEYFFNSDEDYQTEFDKLIKINKMPTAFVCEYDFTAIELIKLLYKKGIRVPDDVSVIGSGNTEMSLLSIPALTTLDLNIEYSCEAAVSLLCRKIKRPDKPCENIAISSTLVERESVKAICNN